MKTSTDSILSEENKDQAFCQTAVSSSVVREFLKSFYCLGSVTEEIAQHFKITNRQVGGIMGNLAKQGLVKSYTKGTITIKLSSTSSTCKMRIDNSFYEWIGD